MAKVALINPAGVEVRALEDVVAEANLPHGEIRLIVGDPLLGAEFQAVTVPRAFVSVADNLCGLEEFLAEPWDCGVLIGCRWASRQAQFPAYFAYLLGHELGHATTVLTNLELTVYEDLILRYVPRVSKDRKWRWDEMPHEIRYDQFGMAVAEALFGRPAVEDEFGRILSDGLAQGERLQSTLKLRPNKDLRGLRSDLASFSLPYRDQLLMLWRQDMQRGRLKIAGQMADLAALWNAT